MDWKEIAALPVAELMAAQSNCYLWIPNALLAEGLAVLEGWGFTYKANLVWAKRRKDGGPDGRGVGFYFRNTTELVLFGSRGKLRTLAPARSQVNVIETRKREHSRKPDEQYPSSSPARPDHFWSCLPATPGPAGTPGASRRPRMWCREGASTPCTGGPPNPRRAAVVVPTQRSSASWPAPGPPGRWRSVPPSSSSHRRQKRVRHEPRRQPTERTLGMFHTGDALAGSSTGAPGRGGRTGHAGAVGNSTGAPQASDHAD
jgi:hypothetical protein